MEALWCKLQVQQDHLCGERSAMKAAGGAARRQHRQLQPRQDQLQWLDWRLRLGCNQRASEVLQQAKKAPPVPPLAVVCRVCLGAFCPAVARGALTTDCGRPFRTAALVINVTTSLQ